MSKNKDGKNMDIKRRKTKDKLEKVNLLKEIHGAEKYSGVSKINRFNILFAFL